MGRINLISKLIRNAVAGLFAAAVAPVAVAAHFEWKSTDGQVSAGLGGGLQLDGNVLRKDDDASFGSPLSPAHSGAYLRRAWLDFDAAFHGWTLRIEPQLVAEPVSGDPEFEFEDVHVGHAVPGGEIRVGQHRPFRGMESLTGFEDLTLIERPFAGNAGVFAGGRSREFALGAFYQGSYDLFAWGLGAYSLRNLNESGGAGLGASGRLNFTPLVANGEVVHLGLSISYEEPDSATDAIGSSVAYAGWRGPIAEVGLARGGEPATTLGLEYANVFGPFYAQAEVMAQRLEQPSPADAQDILAWYVQGSWFLTDETRPYDRAAGVFGSPLPHGRLGAVEIAARFDGVTNRDAETAGRACGGGIATDTCNVQALTLGVNWYWRSHFRVMLNYVLSEQNRGADGDDRPKALVARLQARF